MEGASEDGPLSPDGTLWLFGPFCSALLNIFSLWPEPNRGDREPPGGESHLLSSHYRVEHLLIKSSLSTSFFLPAHQVGVISPFHRRGY